MRTLLAVVCAVFCACATDTTTTIPVAGGKTISLKHGDRGFDPAENDRVVMKSAAASLDVNDRPDVVPATLHWSFMAQMKGGFQPTRVTVSEVTSEPEVPILTDDTPALKDGAWIGRSASFDSGWFMNGESTIKVMKLVFESGGERSELYQGVYFSRQLKAGALDALRKIAAHRAEQTKSSAPPP
jgi:hypothetical protein